MAEDNAGLDIDWKQFCTDLWEAGIQFTPQQIAEGFTLPQIVFFFAGGGRRISEDEALEQVRQRHIREGRTP